jgi:seryl-tRNA synthetase
MLDIKFIRENPEKVKEALTHKNVTGVDVDRLIELDQKRRSLLSEVERRQAEQNRNSDEVARAKAERNESAVRTLLERAVEIKVEIQKLQPDLEFTQREYDELMLRVPNIPMDDVPIGKSEKDNVVVREVWYDAVKSETDFTAPSEARGERSEREPRVKRAGDATNQNGLAREPRVKRAGEVWEVKTREEPYTVREEKTKQFTPPWPYDFAPRSYIDVAGKLDWIDTERAARVSGTRFGYVKREAALMELALVQLAVRLAVREGFTPVLPPVLIKPESMKAMGYVERGGDEIYYLPVDDLYLVGTSEQSVGPMHKNEVFQTADLPRRYIAFSPCFRREAGSYGRDTKGILRVHQFDKVEMVSYAVPGASVAEHQLLLRIEEDLMQTLRIPYRVLRICSADLGDPTAAKFDIEAWMPGQGEYRETHSTSNTTDFQSRRLNIKYRAKEGGTNFVHMLNGTAFAMGRMIIAIIENYQQKDGSVEMPEALKPLMI